MLRSISLFLPAVVLANHLDGPVQDRLDICQQQQCPGSYDYFEMMVEAGTLNVKKWLTEEDYVMNEVPQMFPEVLTHIECICNECPALTEAIWQPIGRTICSKYGVELPCAAELDACLAAGNTKETCYPDNSLYAYQVAYDLSNPMECNALCRNADGENAPPCNHDDPLYAFQKCLATSRTNAGDQSISVTFPCDRSASENGVCKGIPATECKFCYIEGTSEPCDPAENHRRRLLFGGAGATMPKCTCH